MSPPPPPWRPWCHAVSALARLRHFLFQPIPPFFSPSHATIFIDQAECVVHRPCVLHACMTPHTPLPPPHTRFPHTCLLPSLPNTLPSPSPPCRWSPPQAASGRTSSAATTPPRWMRSRRWRQVGAGGWHETAQQGSNASQGQPAATMHGQDCMYSHNGTIAE